MMIMAIKASSFRDRVRDSGLDCKDPSRAVQASKEECDINNIIKKYLRTGELPGVRQLAYADISKIKGLHESLNDVFAAEEAFMALPADVRKYFDNDPVKLVEFASDAKNKEKAMELGLIERPHAPVNSPSQPSPAPAGGQPATPPAGKASP